METGIQWGAYGNSKLSNEKQVALIRKSSFTHTFFPSELEDFDEAFSSAAKENITVDFCHAPFDGINNMWLEGEEGDIMLRRLKDSVDINEKHSIPVLVSHLSSGDNAPRITDRGYERFKELIDYAGKRNVKIAFENQRKLANIAFAMEVYPEAFFCWDTGHEKCFAAGREYMPLFGSRLIALHIHDNFLKKDGDEHMIPGDGGIDFDRVTSLLREFGFTGTVMLEASTRNAFYKNMPPEEFYERAARAARNIARSI